MLERQYLNPWAAKNHSSELVLSSCRLILSFGFTDTAKHRVSGLLAATGLMWTTDESIPHSSQRFWQDDLDQNAENHAAAFHLPVLNLPGILGDADAGYVKNAPVKMTASQSQGTAEQC